MRSFNRTSRRTQRQATFSARAIHIVLLGTAVYLAVCLPALALAGGDDDIDDARGVDTLTLEAALFTGDPEQPTGCKIPSRIGARNGSPGRGRRRPSVEPGFPGDGGPRRERDPSGVGPTAKGTQLQLQVQQTLSVGGKRAARQAVVEANVRAAQSRVAWIQSKPAPGSGPLTWVPSLRDNKQTRRWREKNSPNACSKRSSPWSTAAPPQTSSCILAKREHGLALLDTQSAKNLAQDARQPLRELLAMTPDEPLVLPRALTHPEPPETSLKNDIAVAKRNRQDFRVIDRRAAAIEADLRRLRRENLPDPTLYLAYQRDLPGQHFAGVGLSFALPTFRRRQGAVAENRAALAEEEVNKAQAIANALRKLSAARGKVENLSDALTTLEKDVLPAAKAAENLLQQGWQAGKFSLFRVLEAGRVRWDAKQRYFEILGQLWQAHIVRLRAMGAA